MDTQHGGPWVTGTAGQGFRVVSPLKGRNSTTNVLPGQHL